MKELATAPSVAGTHLLPRRPALLESWELQISSRFFANTSSSHKVVTRDGRAAPPSSLWPRAALVAWSGNEPHELLYKVAFILSLKFNECPSH